MNFRYLQRRIKHLPAFNLNDIRKIDPNFHRQQLQDWIGRDYIKAIVGGMYILADEQVDERQLFIIANRIYQPSYISLESALAFHSVIPESVLGVTSVSSRKTMQYESDWGRLSYRSLKPSLMFGYRLTGTHEKQTFKMASLEKAVLDHLYWNTSVSSIDDLAGLRWNRQVLSGLQENELFNRYLCIFNNKALDTRAHLLMEYINA